MIPYLSILLIFLIGLNNNIKSKEYLYFVFCWLLLLLLASLRDINVGVDTLYYYDEFIAEDERPLEPVWVWCRNTIKSITPDFQIFLTVIAFLTLFPIFHFIKHESEYILLSLLIYFILPSDLGYVMTLNQIRQAFALSLILWFYFAIQQKKWVLAILLGCVAFFIHNTAMIPIVGVLFTYIFSINKKIFIPLLSLSVLFAFSSFNLSEAFSLFENSQLIQVAFIENKISYIDYLTDEYSISFFGTLFLVGPPYTLSILICINQDKCPKVYAKLFLIGTILLCLFAQVPMIKRYVAYFLILEIVLFPYIWNIYKKTNTKYICICLIAFQVFNFILYLYLCTRTASTYINSREIAPYHFFFE